MTPVPCSQQKKITIRSDQATELLREMAVDGRTKVSIIEDALRMVAIKAGLPLEE